MTTNRKLSGYHLGDVDNYSGVQYERRIRGFYGKMLFPCKKIHDVNITCAMVIPCENESGYGKIVVKLSEENEEVAKKVLDDIERELPSNNNHSNSTAIRLI